MGIYESKAIEQHRQLPDGSETWVEISNVPGITRRRRVTAAPYEETRTNCYCCSCPEDGTDPYCRNHGYAGIRPCEHHGMSGDEFECGEVIGKSDSSRPMLSVQAERARFDAMAARR